MEFYRILDGPVPPQGRPLTDAERRCLWKQCGIFYPKELRVVVPCDDDGEYCKLMNGAEHVDFLLVPRRAHLSEVRCLIAPVPVDGRYMLASEANHARAAGMSCSTQTFLRPHPNTDTVMVYTRTLGYDTSCILLVYIPRAAGRPRRAVVDPDGVRRVPCLTDPVPVEGRDMTRNEELLLRRIAPDIKFTSYYIVPWQEGAILPYCTYTGSYILT